MNDIGMARGNVKRVFYVRYLAHTCYLDIIAQRPEIRLDKLENDTADAVAQPIMSAAHAYQVGSARDECAPRAKRNGRRRTKLSPMRYRPPVPAPC